MPGPRDLPLLRWGEELRRSSEARARRRRRLAATAAASLTVALLTATLLRPPRPILVWNASASSPIGLYRISATSPVRGDMALAWPPASARRLAAERSYLPANVPLVKPVAAAEGDEVCAVGESIFVNGGLAAPRREADGEGRPLPRWTGCRRLEPGELLLLATGRADSFDGRYFGITARQEVVGRASRIRLP